MKLNHNNSGFAAEQMAATFLLDKGLILVERNFHCRFGEIDLIMQDGNVLVFIEVKLRTSTAFGAAAYSITPKKQQKLLLTAQYYLQQIGEQNCRFDAIIMTKLDNGHVEWIRNAFEA